MVLGSTLDEGWEGRDPWLGCPALRRASNPARSAAFLSGLPGVAVNIKQKMGVCAIFFYIKQIVCK